MTEAQAGRRWTPPVGPLGELTLASVERAKAIQSTLPRLMDEIAGSVRRPSFSGVLRGSHVGIIAEIKRRSPSKGSINETLVAADRAAAYERGGAVALSVLTEPDRFGGSLDDLRSTRDAVAIPLLRKDFITSDIQLFEARAYGASAVLLIARALPDSQLRDLAGQAQLLELECLIEVRSADELALALDVPEAVIGVNNRDLETLLVDAEVSAGLLPLIPEARVAVYESGVRGISEVVRAGLSGANAVLVGSVLSAAVDAELAVRELAKVARRDRG